MPPSKDEPNWVTAVLAEVLSLVELID